MKQMKEIVFQNNYFYFDATIYEQNLSANAILVYSYLCKCADKTGRCWPSHRTIACACSLSVSTVKQALGELETKDLVAKLPRYREQGGKTSNLYKISKVFQRVCSVGAQIFDVAVSSKAKLIYIHLCKCADKTGQSWPSHRTIARWCAVGVSTVRQALRELADAAIVQIQERRRGDNGQTSNLYKVLQIAKSTVSGLFSRKQDTLPDAYPDPTATMDGLAVSRAAAKRADTGDSQMITGSLAKWYQGADLIWL